MSSSSAKGLASILSAAAIVVACGSEGDSLFQDPNLEGSSGSSGSSGVFTGEGGASSSGEDDDGGLKACATETKKADRLPLDLYLMVDTSLSMNQSVAGGTTKWAAVKAALKGFIADPKSAGLGVGLQYFPKIISPSTPEICSSDATCGAFGPCINNKACVMSGPIKFCKTVADCPATATGCEEVGICQNDQQYACLKTSSKCPNNGPCALYAFTYCTGRDSCTSADYQTPAVAIGTLPATAAALTASIDARLVDGLTPTSAALKGAVDAASSYAVANPTHAVVAVFVTDGLPTECTVQDIPTISAIAQAGVSATPSIKTFVIGVFSDTEKVNATANLNQIAVGGGSGQAFIITTSSNVTQQFQAALDTIRGSSLPCEYTLPKPATGTADYTKVNVQLTSGSGAISILPNAKNATACGTTAGWYYDVDPSTGGTPTKVIMCPASCTALNGDPGAQMDVLLGCKTITRIPK